MQSKARYIGCALSVITLMAGATACSSTGDGNASGVSGAPPNSGGTAPGVAGTSSAAPAGGTASGSGSGGQVNAGGAGVAGSTPGGNAGSGGTPSGQAGTSGASGSGTVTGTAGAGGSGAGAPGEVAPSAGCGKAAGLKNGRASIDVAGTMREYILALPDDYDQAHPYRLFFGWHPWGGSAQQVAQGGYYGLQSQAKGSAIFVAGEGLDFGDNGKGWGNQNGQDIALLNALLDSLRSQLCIDENRIFSTGFSFGGMFSFAAGCSDTSMMRAIAPMAGNTSVAGCGSGARPVAVMGFHGTEDQVVAIDGGRKGRDVFVERNGCTSQTTPAQTTWCDVAGQTYQPCSCVSYEGCKDGYPVTWCEYNGQHMPAPSSGATLWSFFSQF